MSRRAGAVAAVLLVAAPLGACRGPASDDPRDGALAGPVVAGDAAPALSTLDAREATYPADITPPAGTSYPCALTALPRDLPGVPGRERSYLDRTYARILRATQAKLVALRALEQESGATAPLAAYQTTTARLGRALAVDTPPRGLEPFQRDVTAALELQRAFFRRGAELRRSGASMREVYALPEGRQASARLHAAWGHMRERYPRWSAASQDSIYHHLCALDLF